LAPPFSAHQGVLHLPKVIELHWWRTVPPIRPINGCPHPCCAWLEKRFGEHPRYHQAVAWMTKYADWILLFSRYAFWFSHHHPRSLWGDEYAGSSVSIFNIIAGAFGPYRWPSIDFT